ncbi:ATP-binding protein [Vibrio breoganii]|uniref:ATP-binding protein n=1 Tax=Vibrio breoganii TaxID=553239 RepID=UPI000C865471|nr:ATP-binding protein [Vibrio breoganii]PMO65220.1 ATP-binding protein [Vibrio breoganii]
MTIICLPEIFDRDTLQDFFRELESHQNTDNVCLDCSTLQYSKPTAMLVAGSKMRSWIQSRRSKSLKTKRKGVDTYSAVHDYLKHIGFFDFVLMGEGKCVGEAIGSSTYTPITRIEKPTLREGEGALEQWYEDIQSKVRGLAKVVAGQPETHQDNRMYNYLLREIIRNVFEHSGANECYVFGQRWCNGYVEIVVVDEGMGIGCSLRESMGEMTDIDALKQAIKPGVSRTSVLSDDKNTFDNSGFGLYVLTEVARSFGWYALGSNSARIVGFNNNLLEENLNFLGTYLGLRLTRSPADFSQLAKDIIKAGEEDAQTQGIERKASGMSKLF